MTDITQDGSTGFIEPRRGIVERAWEWARANLFNSVLNGILTVIIAALIARIAIPLFNWAVVDATFSAPNDAACKAAGGACWAFIADWGKFLLFGRYPEDQRWRPTLVIVIFVAMMLVSSRARLRRKSLLAILLPALVVSAAPLVRC